MQLKKMTVIAQKKHFNVPLYQLTSNLMCCKPFINFLPLDTLMQAAVFVWTLKQVHLIQLFSSVLK